MKTRSRVFKKEDTVLKFLVDRSFQDIFCHTLNTLGFNSHGFPLDDNTIVTDKSIDGYRCGEYIIRPYGHYSDLPNFEHVPSGYKLSWNKYPLRDSYSNHNLTFVEFMSILGWTRE